MGLVLRHLFMWWNASPAMRTPWQVVRDEYRNPLSLCSLDEMADSLRRRPYATFFALIVPIYMAVSMVCDVISLSDKMDMLRFEMNRQRVYAATVMREFEEGKCTFSNPICADAFLYAHLAGGITGEDAYAFFVDQHYATHAQFSCSTRATLDGYTVTCLDGASAKPKQFFLNPGELTPRETWD